jgi:hypothetical protein
MYNIHSYCIRWAFIDLSAGPFSWGPAVGGEGVRTELSYDAHSGGTSRGRNKVRDHRGCL